MAILISVNVIDGIRQYADSLTAYPISARRAHEKVDMMISDIIHNGNRPFLNPICKYKNLGQVFTLVRTPMISNLRSFVHKDEAKRPWTFSYFIVEDEDGEAKDEIIYKMMYSSFIKESQCSSVIHLSESDLKYIISESVNRIIQEYTDHSVFGWEHAKKKFKDGGATDEVIKKLKDAYDVYAQETASQGRIPNDTGFDLWRDEKDLKSCEQGKGMKFPNYLD